MARAPRKAATAGLKRAAERRAARKAPAKPRQAAPKAEKRAVEVPVTRAALLEACAELYPNGERPLGDPKVIARARELEG